MFGFFNKIAYKLAKSLSDTIDRIQKDIKNYITRSKLKSLNIDLDKIDPNNPPPEYESLSNLEETKQEEKFKNNLLDIIFVEESNNLLVLNTLVEKFTYYDQESDEKRADIKRSVSEKFDEIGEKEFFDNEFKPFIENCSDVHSFLMETLDEAAKRMKQNRRNSGGARPQ